MQLKEIRQGEEYAIYPSRYMSRNEPDKFKSAIRCKVVEVGIVVGSSRGYSRQPKKGVSVEALDNGDDGWGKEIPKGKVFTAESRRVLEPWGTFAPRKAEYEARVTAREEQVASDRDAADKARAFLHRKFDIDPDEIKRTLTWSGSSRRTGIELSHHAVQKLLEWAEVE